MMKVEISKRSFSFTVKDIGEIEVIQECMDMSAFQINLRVGTVLVAAGIKNPSRTELTADLAESVIKMREEKLYSLMTGVQNANQKMKG